MANEIVALENNKTWELKPLSQGKGLLDASGFFKLNIEQMER